MPTLALAEPPVPAGPLAPYVRVKHWLSAVPWTILALPMRAAAFSVFIRSGLVKLDDWNATLDLFRNEYKVPVLPPDLAATMAASMELGLSSLILVGLATRFAVLGLLGMIATIQIFVYPNAWPDHIQWFAFLFPLLMRGPGDWSLDRLVGKWLNVQ